MESLLTHTIDTAIQFDSMIDNSSTSEDAEDRTLLNTVRAGQVVIQLNR